MNFLTLKFNYLKYILELKFKIIYSLLMFFITLITCFLNIDAILYLLAKDLLLNINSNKFFFSNLTEIFFTNIQISVYIAFLITIPFFYFLFFLYFITSLYLYEVFFFYKIFLIWISCYLSFNFFILNFGIPYFLQFFLQIEKNFIFFPIYFEAKFEDYFIIIITWFLKFNFLIQVPFFIYILTFFNIILPKFTWNLKKNWYLSFFFFSAFLSSPDLLTQLSFTFFFIFFFEIFFYSYLFFYFLNFYA